LRIAKPDKECLDVYVEKLLAICKILILGFNSRTLIAEEVYGISNSNWEIYD